MCKLWVLSETYRVISGYPTRSDVTWPSACTASTQGRGAGGRMLPLFLTLSSHHFPDILGIVPSASSPQSRTSLLLHWASFHTEDDEWWQVISNLLGLLFSQSKIVWRCHLLTHFLCVGNMGQGKYFWKAHAGARKNPVVNGWMKWFYWIQQGMIDSLQKCLEVMKHFSIFQRNFQNKTTVKFLFHPFKW